MGDPPAPPAAPPSSSPSSAIRSRSTNFVDDQNAAGASLLSGRGDGSGQGDGPWNHYPPTNSSGAQNGPPPAGDLPSTSGTPPPSSTTRDEVDDEAGGGGGGSNSAMKRVQSEPSMLGQTGPALPRIRVGVAAMDKKARSKPVAEIVARLEAYGEFEVTIFGDATILGAPADAWPVVDCLLSWHSLGFPLKKAQQYAALRRPYLINDVHMQDALLDRRQVYARLQAAGITVPTHVVIDREGLPAGTDPPGFEETEDFIEVGGTRIYKPFVEKPSNAEDHNIYIYYPHSMGGGVKRLFRKVENKSGDYDPNHPGTVRRDGSYIVEEFLTTGGTDVKVYTVGPRYAHAEARKSPVVDGKVTRAADGKELRFPVLLSPQEKEVARAVCLAFGQKVCGFDLLRSAEKGRSFVCDVNGFSMVKNSFKYYDDAAGILRSLILSAVAPHRLTALPPPPPSAGRAGSAGGGSMGGEPGRGGKPLERGAGDAASCDDLAGRGGGPGDEELRCVLAVVRHGDRTPKQKMKVRVTHPALLALLVRHLDAKGKQAKLKSPAELQDLLDATRTVLAELEEDRKKAAALEASGGGGRGSAVGSPSSAAPPSGSPTASIPLPLDADADELREKLRLVRTVLEQGGSFAGVNRKAQLKPLRWVDAALLATVDADDTPAPPASGASTPRPVPVPVEALLILKHGGVLTHAGRAQAETLGSLFRTAMYPRYGPAGGGLLRLHSTYRHDLKIYSSDEGRVQTSAAAFTQGLLDLEGASLTPILVSLVKKDASMLDAFGKGASEDIRAAKEELYERMTYIAGAKKSACVAPLVGGGGGGDMGPGSSSSAPPSPAPSGTLSSALVALAIEGAAETTTQRISGGGVEGAGGSSAAGSDGGLAAPGAPQPPVPHPARGGARSLIHPMPADPLALLTSLVCDLTLLVEHLRQMCLDERAPPAPVSAGGGGPPAAPEATGPNVSSASDRWRRASVDAAAASLRTGGSGGGGPGGANGPAGAFGRASGRGAAYSALTQACSEWAPTPGQPCGGERLLLLFDRWRKLLKAVHNPKKGEFDISKVPDIYDSAKYDAIHNADMVGAVLTPVYCTAKQLADCVIPNEYGTAPPQKLRIGATIASSLLAKLLCDLANVRAESLETAGLDDGSEPASPFDSYVDTAGALAGGAPPSAKDGGTGRPPRSPKPASAGGGTAPPGGADPEGGSASGGGAPGASGNDDEDDGGTLYRLCPTYAHDINSPLRHVRTRIYFTSESHLHALVNVLRYGHMAGAWNVGAGGGVVGAGGSTSSGGEGGGGASGDDVGFRPPTPAPLPHLQPGSLVSTDAAARLRDTPELDYMTHVVIRMYERRAAPVGSPDRFRVELLFSPGAAVDPRAVGGRARAFHTLPVQPRMHLERGGGLVAHTPVVTVAGGEEGAAPAAAPGGGGGGGEPTPDASAASAAAAAPGGRPPFVTLEDLERVLVPLSTPATPRSERGGGNGGGGREGGRALSTPGGTGGTASGAPFLSMASTGVHGGYGFGPGGGGGGAGAGGPALAGSRAASAGGEAGGGDHHQPAATMLPPFALSPLASPVPSPGPPPPPPPPAVRTSMKEK